LLILANSPQRFEGPEGNSLLDDTAEMATDEGTEAIIIFEENIPLSSGLGAIFR
jgi:hypothetical protein